MSGAQRDQDPAVTPGDPGSVPTPPADPGSSPSPAAEYRLTFPLKYNRVPYPTAAATMVTPEGWVTIVAPSYSEARYVAMALFGPWWSGLYDLETFEPDWYPRGELLRVVVPAGLIELEDHR